ncbi:hypothetical protein ACLOJK_034409, partial [Asimina triloba]
YTTFRYTAGSQKFRVPPPLPRTAAMVTVRCVFQQASSLPINLGQKLVVRKE